MNSMEPRSALQTLQDEILQLKQVWPSLKPKRTAEGPNAPFPISLTTLVQPPDSAAAYDIGPFTATIVLHKALLELGTQGFGTDVLSFKIANDSLPPQLCSKIESLILESWQQAVIAKYDRSHQGYAGALLNMPLQQLSDNCVSLICSIPSLVERYETVDQYGRTVRRYTILNQADTDGPEASTSLQETSRISATQQDVTPVPAPTTEPTSPGNHSVCREQPVNTPTQAWVPLPLNQLLSELQYLIRRSPGQLKLIGTQPTPSGVPALVSAAPSHAQQPPASRLSVSAKAFVPGIPSAPLAPKFIGAGKASVPAAQVTPAALVAVTQPAHSQPTNSSAPNLDVILSAVRAVAASPSSACQGTASNTASGNSHPAGVTVSIDLLPTDPAWERGQVSLWCEVRPVQGAPAAASPPMQEQAPQQSGASEVVEVCLRISPACAMPTWLRQALDAALASEVSKASASSGVAPARGPRAAGGLRDAIRQFENYAGVLSREAESAARAAGQRTALGQSAVYVPGSSAAAPAGASDSSAEGSDSGSGTGTFSDDEGSETDSSYGDEEEEEGTGDEGGQDEVQFTSGGQDEGGATAGPAAWALVLEGLKLDQLVAAEALTTSLQVSCSRCSGTGIMTVASEAVSASASGSSARTVSATCAQCAASWSLVLRPKFIHEASNVLCVVKPEGCRPIDLLPSMYAAQCATCSSVMSLRNVQVGLPASRTCSSCHQQLSLFISAVSFVPRGPPAGAGKDGQGGRAGKGTSSNAAAARAALARTQGTGAYVLQVGTPLPGRGACKHYKHSYRWLRFPCCGLRFPCDLCHEEHVPDGHEPRWATRMVCGFCSVEQPVGDECKACGKKLTATGSNPSGRFTRFWEGGEGCRDKSRMNKNDPHKYRNSNNKTKSAKHKRVGPKAWSKELKKQEG